MQRSYVLHHLLIKRGDAWSAAADTQDQFLTGGTAQGPAEMYPSMTYECAQLRSCPYFVCDME